MKRRSTGRTTHFAIALTLAATIGLLGCATTPEETDQDSGTGSEWQDAATPSDSDSGSDMGASSGSSADFQTVYFDFDRFDIRPDARSALKSNAGAIGSTGGRVTIAGHCDERGSSEYNLALGERRANAAKRYLVDLGVSSSRLRTVSFGEDRPAVQGHDESAWRYNRRAEFSIE